MVMMGMGSMVETMEYGNWIGTLKLYNLEYFVTKSKA
jgi:hypothetical protein